MRGVNVDCGYLPTTYAHGTESRPHPGYDISCVLSERAGTSAAAPEYIARIYRAVWQFATASYDEVR